MGKLVPALLVVIGVTAPASPITQSGLQQPVFRGGVENVEVDVVVTRNGQVVHDLTQHDFRVFEDGKPQTLTAFARIDIPVEGRHPALTPSPVIESDVVTNEHTAEGRVYVLVIDELHISPRSVATARSAANAFIERLGTNDLMAVVHTAGPETASQEFTNSKRRLLEAVDQTTPHSLESATAVRNETAIASGGRTIEDTFDLERAQTAETSLRVLHDVATWFGAVQGRRKAILFVSEGIDYAMSMVDRPTELNSPWDVVLRDAREAVDASMRSNVGVYAIDPNRMSGVDDLANEYFQPRSPTLGPRSAQRELRANQDNLRWLAEQTGGIAIVGRTDLEKAYDAIIADNSTYYVLAYVPPTHAADGKFHKITVRVDRPGIAVRARSGYVSASKEATAPVPGGPSPEIRQALATPVPVGGVPIRLSVAPFKGAGPNASVLVTEDLIGHDLKLDALNALDLSYAAIDAHGTPRAMSHDRLQLGMLDGESMRRIEQSGIRVFNRLNLPPGRYSVKVAAHDEAGGTTGSIGYDLDVPHFDARPIGVSGLVLTSLGTDRLIVAKPDPQTSQVLPAPPITQRAFSNHDQVWVFAEIYDNLRDAPHMTAIATIVTSDAGTIVYTTVSDHDPTEFHGQPGTFRYRVRVPLSDLTPGRYVLAVEARTHGSRAEVARQAVPITVATSNR